MHGFAITHTCHMHLSIYCLSLAISAVGRIRAGTPNRKRIACYLFHSLFGGINSTLNWFLWRAGRRTAAAMSVFKRFIRTPANSLLVDLIMKKFRKWRGCECQAPKDHTCFVFVSGV